MKKLINKINKIILKDKIIKDWVILTAYYITGFVTASALYWYLEM